MIVDSEELRAAIRERDEIIARIRAVEAGLLPLIEAMSQGTPAKPAAGSQPRPEWVTNAGRGPVRTIDYDKFPSDRFGGQILYESEAITVHVNECLSSLTATR